MTRREILAGFAVAPLVRPQSRGPKPINVVFFLTDDHGAWSLGSYGCPEFHTPNVDALAAGGAMFSRTYAATPVCSPSRMTYLTGKLPSGHGVHDAMLAEDCWGSSRRIGAAMTVSAHFDGKVIVPDEPLDLPPNQALILQIQTVGSQVPPAEGSVLTWLAANAVDSEALPVDLADRHDHYLYGRSSGNEQR